MTFTVQERDQILAKCLETQSIPVTQRWVRQTLQKAPLYFSDILTWARSVFETGNLAHHGENG